MATWLLRDISSVGVLLDDIALLLDGLGGTWGSPLLCLVMLLCLWYFDVSRSLYIEPVLLTAHRETQTCDFI